MSTFLEQFKGRFERLGTRIITVSVFACAATAGATAWAFSHAFSDSAQEKMVHSARAVVQESEAARDRQLSLIRSKAIHMDELLEEARVHMQAGGNYRDTSFFEMLPIVSAWRAAEAAKESHGIDLRVIAARGEARNESNHPEAGGFS